MKLLLLLTVFLYTYIKSSESLGLDINDYPMIISTNSKSAFQRLKTCPIKNRAKVVNIIYKDLKIRIKDLETLNTVRSEIQKLQKACNITDDDMNEISQNINSIAKHLSSPERTIINYNDYPTITSLSNRKHLFDLLNLATNEKEKAEAICHIYLPLDRVIHDQDTFEKVKNEIEQIKKLCNITNHENLILMNKWIQKLETQFASLKIQEHKNNPQAN